MTTNEQALSVYSCSTCQPGQAGDNHPKVHYGPDRYHYGCLPAEVKADILGDGSTAQQKRLASIIEAAEGGKTGEDLRKHAVAAVKKIPDDVPSDSGDKSADESGVSDNG